MDCDEIIHPEIKTDGIYRCYYIDDKDGAKYNYLLQLECKLDIDFNDKDEKAKTILQVICYIKQIHDNILGYSAGWESNAIPKVIVIGSKINCFTLPARLLLPYAQTHIEGFKSASTAYIHPENQIILQRIKEDAHIEVHSILYNTEDKDCISNLCNEIVKLGRGLQITDDLSEATLSKAFDFFDMYVLDSKFAKNKTSREKVAMFIGVFFSDEFREMTSGRGNTSINELIVNGIEIKVNPDYYNKFKLLYSVRDYSRLEQKQITAITDRLIEDTDRRRKGDFYTPTIWVDEAHKLLDKNLGSNWRDEYIVWDCAWGTGNLTRDYQFKELYCSTINQEELNIGARYNRNATKFQYDFLNDDVEEFEQARDALRSPFRFKAGVNVQAMEQYINFKDITELYSMAVDKGIITVEEGQSAYSRAVNILRNTKLYEVAPRLIESLIDGGEQGKKLLFFINPPYGTGSDMKSITQGIQGKSGIGFTAVYEDMELSKIKGRRNIYTQFLYRIYRLYKEVGIDFEIGVFTPSSLLNNDMNSDIRKLYNSNKINLKDSFMIRASSFSDVADNWAITFSLWGTGEENDITAVLDLGDTTEVQVIEEHILKQISKDNRALDWIRSDKKYKKVQSLVQTSAINVHEKYRSIDEDSLCQIMCNMNIVESNLLKVTLIQNPTNANWAIIGVHKNNFDKVVSYFCARKLVQPSWINCKDEYMVPNLLDHRYLQWNLDCIIYSLFNTASNFVSMRDLQFNKIWNIQNEFFWLSYKEIEKLAGGLYDKEDINTAIEDDIEQFGKERFVYQKLQEITLSPDAQAVLDKATDILKKTFKYRKQFNISHPEYHINTWDAGWYQIKALAKEYLLEDLKQFNDLYKALGDRMRPLVYELGFLYK